MARANELNNEAAAHTGEPSSAKIYNPPGSTLLAFRVPRATFAADQDARAANLGT